MVKIGCVLILIKKIGGGRGKVILRELTLLDSPVKS